MKIEGEEEWRQKDEIGLYPAISAGHCCLAEKRMGNFWIERRVKKSGEDDIGRGKSLFFKSIIAAFRWMFEMLQIN